MHLEKNKSNSALVIIIVVKIKLLDTFIHIHKEKNSYSFKKANVKNKITKRFWVGTVKQSAGLFFKRNEFINKYNKNELKSSELDSRCNKITKNYKRDCSHIFINFTLVLELYFILFSDYKKYYMYLKIELKTIRLIEFSINFINFTLLLIMS